MIKNNSPNELIDDEPYNYLSSIVGNFKVLIGDLNCEYNVVEEKIFRSKFSKYMNEHYGEHLRRFDIIENTHHELIKYKQLMKVF